MLVLSERLGKRLRRWKFPFVLAEVALAPPLLLFYWYLTSIGLGREQFNEALLRFKDALLNLQARSLPAVCWEVGT